jgi:monovalent cation/hydrogen antiporter
VLRELQYDLDLEEALLDRRMDDASGHLDQLRATRTDRGQEPGDPADTGR